MPKSKRKYVTKRWHTRQFLRPKGDDAGPGSVLDASCYSHVFEETKYDRDLQKRVPTGVKRISISGSLTIRDCSNEISLGFHAGSEGRKRAVAQLVALTKVKTAVDRLKADYEKAIAYADKHKLWPKNETEDYDDY